MNYLLVLPPVVFLIILAFCWIMFKLTSTIAFKETSPPAGQCKPYACGEDLQKTESPAGLQPVFPVRFLFHDNARDGADHHDGAILAIRYSGNAFLYVIGGVCGLLILFRR